MFGAGVAHASWVNQKAEQWSRGAEETQPLLSDRGGSNAQEP